MKLAWAASLVIFAAGCAPRGLVLNRQNLGMESSSIGKNVFTVGTTHFPVDISQASSGGTITISVQDEGEEIEREEYKIDGSTLNLSRASDDTFDPPMPLLQFPAHAGQTYRWSGSIKEAGFNRPASASISVASDTLHFKTRQQPALLSTVNLSISSQPQPATRTFQFWFVPGGVVRRVFGMGTSRAAVDLETESAKR